MGAALLSQPEKIKEVKKSIFFNYQIIVFTKIINVHVVHAEIRFTSV